MEFLLESGAKLLITESSFEDAIELNDSLLNAVGDLKLTDDILNADIDLANPMNAFAGTSGLLSLFTNKIRSIASCPGVRHHILKCGERAVYENVRVSKDLFDDPKIGSQARKDFYVICMKIIEVNCQPFLESLVSLLKINIKTLANTQKQKSTAPLSG